MASALRSPRLQSGERMALANELLEQQYQFRQNLAMLHGLPMPEGPGKVEDMDPEPEDKTDESIDKLADSVTTSAERVVEAVAEAVSTTAASSPISGTANNGTGNGSFLKKAALLIALITGGAAIPFIGGVGASLLNKNDATTTAPAPTHQADTPDTEGNLLLELQRRGLDISPTDLGTDIQRAFKLNPKLREQLLRDVRRTLEENGVNFPTN